MARLQPSKHWHVIELPEVYECLNASEHGISYEDAETRLGEFGPNSLPEQAVPSLWQIFVRQFFNPLIYILLAAAGVSLFIGDVKDAMFIAAVLCINATIGTYQERQRRRTYLRQSKYGLCRHYRYSRAHDGNCSVYRIGHRGWATRS